MTPGVLALELAPQESHYQWAPPSHREGAGAGQWLIRTFPDAWLAETRREALDLAETVIEEHRAKVFRQRQAIGEERWDRHLGELPVIDLSQGTIAVVRDGFVYVSNLMERLSSASLPAARIGDRHVSEFVNDRLQKAFSSAAHLSSAFGVRSRVVGRHGGLSDDLDALIQERIPVRLKAFATFSDLLQADLARHLERGGKYERPWGKLRLDAGTVIMDIQPREAVTVRRGRRARIVD